MKLYTQKICIHARTKVEMKAYSFASTEIQIYKVNV